jgi:mRNA-degrading endonuclease YafQ of YafQ-DinJ toxin-antitoxin module
MSYRLVFTEGYNKRASKWLGKHTALRDQYLKTLQLMELNINHPSLRLHKLSGRLNGLSSVSINVSYRITLELIIQDKDIIMINIGAHDEVYK